MRTSHGKRYIDKRIRHKLKAADADHGPCAWSWRKTSSKCIERLQPKPHLVGVVSYTTHRWIAKNLLTKEIVEGKGRTIELAKLDVILNLRFLA